MSAIARQPATHCTTPKREALGLSGSVVVRWIIRGMAIDDAGRPVILSDLSQSAILECRVDRSAGARAELSTADGRRRVVLHVCERLAPGAFEATPAGELPDTLVVSVDVAGLFSSTFLAGDPGRLLYVRTTLLDALAVPGGRAELLGFENVVN